VAGAFSIYGVVAAGVSEAPMSCLGEREVQASFLPCVTPTFS
jgi:hypothetical protein